MESVTDVTFLVLSQVNNDLFLYAFATSVACKVRYVGTVLFKNISFISAKVTCTINFSVKGAQIKYLDTQFPGGEQVSNLK